MKSLGTDPLLCSATLETTFFKYLNGVSSIRENISLGYRAVYIDAKEAPILFYELKCTSFPIMRVS